MLNEDEVKQIAHLARLQITPEQIPDYATRLSEILDLVEQLNQVDTRHVTPMAHPQHNKQRLREDIVTESDQRQHFQAGSPAVKKGLFLVPKVIE